MMLEISLVIIAVLTLAAVRVKDLVYAVILLGVADVVLALGFYLLAAPDIAITQASVVAGLTTFIFLIAIGKTRRMEETTEGGKASKPSGGSGK